MPPDCTPPSFRGAVVAGHWEIMVVGANPGCNAPESSFQAGGPFAPGRAVIAQSGGTGAWDALSRSCRVLQEATEQCWSSLRGLGPRTTSKSSGVAVHSLLNLAGWGPTAISASQSNNLDQKKKKKMRCGCTGNHTCTHRALQE